VERIRFGNTGLYVSRLAIGTGTHGWNGRSLQTDLGFDALVGLLRASADRGVNLWDSADQYGSHKHIREAMKGLKREEIVIITKSTSGDERGMKQDLDRFRKELGTDYLDVVLLHAIADPKWNRRKSGAMDALARAKEEGIVRAVGISSHSVGALRTAISEPWVDVVLVRINYAGIDMDADPKVVIPMIRDLAERGKAVYGMKVLGCGRLREDPEKAIRFALGIPGLSAITIGMVGRDELEVNARIVEGLEGHRV
jgi:aryl-alcohol dehydrogenase-like predicted oxidoreductase